MSLVEPTRKEGITGSKGIEHQSRDPEGRFKYGGVDSDPMIGAGGRTVSLEFSSHQFRLLSWGRVKGVRGGVGSYESHSVERG